MSHILDIPHTYPWHSAAAGERGLVRSVSTSGIYICDASNNSIDKAHPIRYTSKRLDENEVLSANITNNRRPLVW